MSPEPVLAAMCKPLLGYLDPDFIRVLDEVVGMLKACGVPKFGSTCKSPHFMSVLSFGAPQASVGLLHEYYRAAA